MKRSSTRRRHNRRRRLIFEQFEQRLLLTGDMPSPLSTPDPALFSYRDMEYNQGWADAGGATDDTLPSITELQGIPSRGFDTNPHQNPLNPYDTNRDFNVSPFDALTTINRINEDGPGPLPSIQPGSFPDTLVDVNGDGLLTPKDVLHIINRLNDPAYVSPAISQFTSTAANRTYFTSTSVSGLALEEENPPSQTEREHAARSVLTVSGSYGGILNEIEMTTHVRLVAGRLDSDNAGFGEGFAHSAISTTAISGWGELFITVSQNSALNTEQTFTCCGIVELEDDTERITADLDVRVRGQFHVEVTTITTRSNLFFSLTAPGSNESQSDYSQLTESRTSMVVTGDWMNVSGETLVLTEDMYDYGSVPVTGRNFSLATSSFRAAGGGTVSLDLAVDGSRLLGYSNGGFVRDNHRGATITTFSDGVDAVFDSTGTLEASGAGYMWGHQRDGHDVDNTTKPLTPGYSQSNEPVLNDVLADRAFLLELLAPYSQ